MKQQVLDKIEGERVWVEIDPERFHLAYRRLVDETENPLTYRERQKNTLLRNLLDLMEYLQGDDVEDPLNSFFGKM